MFTGHQVKQFQIQFDANRFGCHLDGTAWSWSRSVVEVNTHFELVLTEKSNKKNIKFD